MGVYNTTESKCVCILMQMIQLSMYILYIGEAGVPNSEENNLPAIIAGSLVGVLVVVVIVGLVILILACVLKRSGLSNIPQRYNCNPNPGYNYKETSKLCTCVYCCDCHASFISH